MCRKTAPLQRKALTPSGARIRQAVLEETLRGLAGSCFHHDHSCSHLDFSNLFRHFIGANSLYWRTRAHDKDCRTDR